MGFVTGVGMKRALYRVDEVAEMLTCSRRKVYDLLSTGDLQAHHRDKRPGLRGLRITAVSVEVYLESGIIPKDEWLK